MRIEVTDADIALGVRRIPMACPVARAIRRTLARSGHLFVYLQAASITVGNGPDFTRHPTPPEAADAVGYYDRTGRMAPFGFDLPPASPARGVA